MAKWRGTLWSSPLGSTRSNATLIGKTHPREGPSSPAWMTDGIICGYGAPKERGGRTIKANILCPKCDTHRMDQERHYIGGRGYISMFVCNDCGWFEREA